MPPASFHAAARTLTRRIAGFWMIVLALGLTLVGVVLSLQQARTLVVRLMAPAELRAAHLAETARRIFHEELAAALDAAARDATSNPDDSPAGTFPFPAWLDAAYVWDGKNLAPLPGFAAGSRNRPWEGSLPDRLRPVVKTPSPPDPWIVRVENEKGPYWFALRRLSPLQPHAPDRLLVLHLDPERLQENLIAPLLPSGDMLEIAETDADSPWSQRLFPPLQSRVIRPTSAYAAEQRRTVFRLVAVQLALPALALLMLLAAMAILVRTARREVALAEMKANFVADVSHELKTPLALIHLFAETLQSGKIQSEEKKREYYEVILRECSRLTAMIENILDFSRIDAGRKEYRPEPIDIARLVRETYETYTARLDHEGFEHRFTAEEGLPPVAADAGAIKQAIINLLDNAVKYSDEEKSLHVELRRDVRRGRRGVLISIHDRGIGIRPEDRARIFDGFYRAPDERVRARGGAGLGLRLVRHIVECHGGALDVESRLVKGSTFRIFLPAAEVGAAGSDRTGPPAAPPREADRPNQQETQHGSNPDRRG
ncbi:MAG: sensor histidine kinase [Planctomycetota bacterium]|nr:MAG: sensor histidine kinase [Planctomycetota bacterium]